MMAYPAIAAIIAFTLVMVAVVFTVLIVLDLWAICIPRPMPWNVWTMVCAGGVLSLFFCCGLLAACAGGTIWLIIFAVINGFTAFLFLLELMWLLG